MTNSVIVTALRTPIGSFRGSLSSFRSPELGGIVIRELLSRAAIPSVEVDEGIMGCVLAAGLGQAPARQAILSAGLPESVSATTVNKVCSSGLKAVMLADQSIRTGDSKIAVAGGMESMTNAPYVLPEARLGYRMGNGNIVDSMLFDGLWDIYSNQHMGMLAEMLAEKNKIRREEQDEYAIRSYKRAIAARDEDRFRDEIVPVEIKQRKGDPIIFTDDEELGKVNFEKISKLKPVFKKDGTITAANASSISDGAAALLVMEEEKAKELSLKPLGRIIAYDSYSQEPEWFTTAPINAVKKILKKAGMDICDIELFELNEAFSVQSLAVMKELGLDESKVNVNGGAVAIGHPIGCSGARILVTLIHELRRRNSKFGLASLCNGGGEATAMIVEAF